MTKTKMTIHRALAELKLIDSKIENQINDINPIGVHQKGKLINNYVKEEDFKSRAESNYTSVLDLIKRKSNIKSGIVQSNSNTKVTISGKEMSVADAITAKSTVDFKKKLIVKLNTLHTQSVGHLNRNNELIAKNMQAILEATFGKENVKAGEGDVNSVRKPYMEANEFHLFDPIEVTKKVEALQKEVSEFEAEVDATLSESNAVTFIEV